MKFGIGVLVKNENLYLREWVKYHINLGFDKIVLFDNNPIGGENPLKVIQDYVDAGFIEIWNCPQIIENTDQLNEFQVYLYNKCLDAHTDFDWFTFIDVDEFISIDNYTNIKDQFSSHNDYEGYDNVLMCWYVMGDPNALYYDDRPVMERFKVHLEGTYGWLNNEPMSINTFVKSFIRPKSTARFIKYIHCTNSKHTCISNGLLAYTNEITTRLSGPNHEEMRLNHYYTKSLTEYLYRCQSNKHKGNFDYVKYEYTNFNGWSDEHEKVFQEFIKRYGSGIYKTIW